MIRRAVIIAFVALAGLSLGCESIRGCEAGTMRCHGNRSEMCDATGQWALWQDCTAVGETCGNGPSACSGFDVACCR